MCHNKKATIGNYYVQLYGVSSINMGAPPQAIPRVTSHKRLNKSERVPNFIKTQTRDQPRTPDRYITQHNSFRNTKCRLLPS